MLESNPNTSTSPTPAPLLPVRWYAIGLILILLLGASCLGLLEVLRSGSLGSIGSRAAQLQRLQASLGSDLNSLPDVSDAGSEPGRELTSLVNLCSNYRTETKGLEALSDGAMSGGVRRAEEQMTAACLIPGRLAKTASRSEVRLGGVEFRRYAQRALNEVQTALADQSSLAIESHARQQRWRLAELVALTLLVLGGLGYLLWWRATAAGAKEEAEQLAAATARTAAAGSTPPQWMRAAVESTTDGIVMVDRAGQIRAANPAAEELLGWGHGELIGKAAAEVIPAFAGRDESSTRGEWPQAVTRNQEGIESERQVTWIHRQDPFNTFTLLHVPPTVAIAPGRGTDVAAESAPPAAAGPVIVPPATEPTAPAEQQQQPQPGRLAPGEVDSESLQQLENQILLVTGYSEVALYNLSASDPMRPDIEQLARAGTRAALLCREATMMPTSISKATVNLNGFLKTFEQRLRSMAGSGVDILRRVDNVAGSVESDAELLEQALLSLALNALPSIREPLLIRLSCSLGRIEMAMHTRGAVNLRWRPDPVIKPNRAWQWLELLGATVEHQTAERGGHRFRIHLHGNVASAVAASTAAATPASTAAPAAAAAPEETAVVTMAAAPTPEEAAVTVAAGAEAEETAPISQPA